MKCKSCGNEISFFGQKIKCCNCQEVFCKDCSFEESFSISKNTNEGWCCTCYIENCQHPPNPPPPISPFDLDLLISENIINRDPKQYYSSWNTIYSNKKSRIMSAFCIEDKKTYAIKIIRDDGNIEKVLKEYLAAKQIVSKNVLRNFKLFGFDQSFYIVSELMDLSLEVIIKNTTLINEKIVVHIIKEILNGLADIHMQNKAHRDLKPSNIYLNLSGDVKIGDFGEVGKTDEVNDMMSTYVGSPLYMAPEIYLEGERKYDYLCDIWSLGITILELTHSKLFESKTIDDLRHEILNNEPPQVNKIFSRALSEICRRCLNKNPALRSNANELINLKFFKKAKDCSKDLVKLISQVMSKVDMPNK